MVLKKAFTLMEVIIALVLSSAIILGLGMLYRMTVKTQETFNSYKRGEIKSEFLILLQRQLYGVRSFKFIETQEGLILSYLTNYGQVKPFVRVNVRISKKGIVYQELNPYSGTSLVKYSVPWRCSAEVINKKTLMLSCGKYVFKFLIVPLKETF